MAHEIKEKISVKLLKYEKLLEQGYEKSIIYHLIRSILVSMTTHGTYVDF